MKAIAELVDLMDDELESAKDYAERYIMLKSNNDEFSDKFKSMSEDELKHSITIHDLAIREINRLSEIYNPPVAMQEIWDKKHTKYIEQTAWIKQMLTM